MTFEVQVQKLSVQRFYIDAEDEQELRELYRRKGANGINDQALELVDGEDDETLLSIAVVQ